MDVGIVVRPELAPEQLADHARRAEAAGFDELWLWEDSFFAGGIAASATALAATDRITVGLGIMPAPVRNAAFAAMEAATLARLHPGRFHAGLGHGVADWMRQVGAKPKSSLTLLEETVAAVRALLAGETVNVEGRYVRLRDVALDQAPCEPPLVSVGVRGPKGLELSGRAAAGRTEPHRLTVFALASDDARVVRRAAEERRAEGGGQADFLAADTPLWELAVMGGDAREQALGALAEAGADCVVLVSPDPGVPLDPA